MNPKNVNISETKDNTYPTSTNINTYEPIQKEGNISENFVEFKSKALEKAMKKKKNFSSFPK